MDFWGEDPGCDPGGVLRVQEKSSMEQTSQDRVFAKAGKSALCSGEENAESICCAYGSLDETEEDTNAVIMTYFKERGVVLPRWGRRGVVQPAVHAGGVQ